VSRNLAPPGDDRLRVRGLFNVLNLIPEVDPIANGFSFAVYGQNGDEIMSFVVPPGAQPDTRSPGWKVNRSGTRWSFKDRDGTLAGGIRRVSIVHKVNRAVGLFLVSVTAKDGDYHIDPAQLPLRLDLVLGSQPQADEGQCAAGVFNPEEGDRPRCRSRREGSSISCS